MLRQPILVFMGNVDAGKTQLLDTIRSSAIVAKEAGGITQAIGASIIPIDTIKEVCGGLLKEQSRLTVPGILTIDTPGHAAFTNLRKRGGNLADMAVLVIDIKDGVKPQTVECIDILKQYKIPFVVALNKLDTLSGWKSSNKPLLTNLGEQPQNIQTEVETKLYEVVGKLAEFGINADRFDRVSDYTKQIAILPTSAKTGEGIPELLMVLVGLSQRYLEQKLEVHPDQDAQGTVLEVTEEKGLGKTLDVIIYDGHLAQGDTIVIGSMGEPIVTKVRKLFEPAPMSQMGDKKNKYKSVKEVYAAIGVKINAPDVDDVVAGMPLRSTAPEKAEEVGESIKKEVQEVILETDKEGIIVKADSLGSLEAVVKLFREHDIKIIKASVGAITKKDMTDAECNLEKDPFDCVVIGFNVAQLAPDSECVKVITGDIIYKLIDDFKAWQDQQRKKMQEKELESITKPCKVQLMKGYVFRQSSPAVAGTDILAGTLETGASLMKNDGSPITQVKSIQHDQEKLEKAEKGKQVAVSYPGVSFGRQFHEDDILYSFVSEEEFRRLKELKKLLTEEDKQLLREIAQIMRKRNPVWGI